MSAPLMALPRRGAPRAVFNVIADRCADRAVADAVARGVFDHAGVCLELGIPPDWEDPRLPADEEWRIEWVKFYYGLDLAAAFVESGKRRYLDAWQTLVRSWIEQNAPARDTADVTARRVQNWIYAWRRFAESPAFEGLDDGLDDTLLASIAAQLEHIERNLSAERNHRTLELYALFIASLALPELDPGGVLLARAIAWLDENLQADFRADGVHREGSTHYHMIVLRTFLGVIENARCFALDLPNGFRKRVERACRFMLHAHRPDGRIPAISDADSESYLDLLALAARLFDREDFAYVASRGTVGTPPEERCIGFPAAGYFIQRSGWTGSGGACADERYLFFDCGPIGAGGHGHYDALSFEAYAYGAPLVVDPGRYTYSEESPDAVNWRHWFKGTRAHNTVVVDGLDQTPYRRGKPRAGAARARLVLRASTSSGRLDMLVGEVRSPCYDAVHRRRILFVAGAYWLVEDVLEGEREHDYELRFHLPAGTAVRACTAHAPVVARLTTARLALDVWPQAELRLEEGWVSPLYGVKHAAPVVCATLRGSRNGRFLSLLAPRRVLPEQAGSGAWRDGALLAVATTADAGDRRCVQATAAVVELGRRYIDVVTWSDEDITNATSVRNRSASEVHEVCTWVRRDADTGEVVARETAVHGRAHEEVPCDDA